MSLPGCDVKVPIKILRDTAAYDSFIVGSVLSQIMALLGCLGCVPGMCGHARNEREARISV